ARAAVTGDDLARAAVDAVDLLTPAGATVAAVGVAAVAETPQSNDVLTALTARCGTALTASSIVPAGTAAAAAEAWTGAARGSDGVAISVVRDTAKYLGMAAANVVAIVDPDMLVLGGIIASAHDLLLEPVRVEVARRLPRAMVDALAVVPAVLGADAVAI